MVCKNCGADLKPGIKYCLECGNYIEEEDNDEYQEIGTMTDDSEPIVFEEETEKKKDSSKARKKKKKLNLSTTDWLIYAALGVVFIGSILVIIVTLATGDSQTNQQVEPSPTVVQDKTVSIDNYKLVVPGSLRYEIHGKTLQIFDDSSSLKFSYKVSEDSFDKYLDDTSLITKQLEASNYKVNATSEKNVNSRKFLVYDITGDGSTKHLYLTDAGSKYIVMGTIEMFTGTNWEAALSIVDKLNSTLEFTINNDEDME